MACLSTVLAWFLPFLKKIEDLSSAQLAIKQDIEDMRHQIAELRPSPDQPSVATLQKRIDELDLHSSTCFFTNMQFQDAVNNLDQTTGELDQCEVLHNGLPADPVLSNETIATRITKAVGVPGLSNHVAFVREWKLKVLSSTSTAHTKPACRAVVLRMASSSSRNQLVSNSHKLTNLSTDSVFGSGGGGRLSMRALWPKHIYE